jgi:protocatechuate 3,4-dioxygenase alpha subunit
MTLPLTPSQTVGPYFAIGLFADPSSELVSPDEPGAVRIEGRVFDGAGEPLNDAMVELWQPDGEGVFHEDWGWGRCGTDEEGRYSFLTAKPGRLGASAPYLTVMVFARGLQKAVLTRLYFPDEAEANATDRVLASLSAEEQATLVAVADGGGLRFDVHLQGARQTVFFAL